MKIRFAAVLLALVALTGCPFCPPVPAEIKREISFVDVVVRTGVKEAAAEPDDKKRAEKAFNALKRLAPHTKNLLNFAEGNPPEGD